MKQFIINDENTKKIFCDLSNINRDDIVQELLNTEFEDINQKVSIIVKENFIIRKYYFYIKIYIPCLNNIYIFEQNKLTKEQCFKDNIISPHYELLAEHFNKILFGKHISDIYKDTLLLPISDFEYVTNDLNNNKLTTTFFQRQQIIHKLEDIYLDNLKEDSSKNKIFDDIVIAKNSWMLAIYIKPTKIFYTYMEDEDNLWCGRNVRKDVDLTRIILEKGLSYNFKCLNE